MPRICSIEECGKKVIGRGWCESHYRRWLDHGHPLAGHTYIGAPKKWLLNHIDYEGTDCLIWPFSRGSFGYGRIFWNGKMQEVHSVLCERHYGPRPTPLHHSAHSCGNGHLGCVNRNHLRWATPTANIEDAIRHGTFKFGENRLGAKLTDAQAREIKAVTGMGLQKIADQYGVSKSTVNDIKHGRRWRRAIEGLPNKRRRPPTCQDTENC